MHRRPPRPPLFPYPTLFRSPCSGGFPTVQQDGRPDRGGAAVMQQAGTVAKPYQRCRSVLGRRRDRKSTRLNSSHRTISYAVFCLKKKKNEATRHAEPSTDVH